MVETYGESIRKFFTELKILDMNFFHAFNINLSQLKNVIWIHPQFKVTYQKFHDILSFDTTYLINKRGMSFSLFIGVNHHYKSIFSKLCMISYEIRRYSVGCSPLL